MTEAVDKMRGKVGQKITLTLVRGGGAPFDVTLTRATSTSPSTSRRTSLKKPVAYRALMAAMIH